MGRNRAGVLELALLGLLHQTPMHGYELRRQRSSLLGTFRALSFGSLYPCLNDLLAEGLIAEEHDEDAGPASGIRQFGYSVEVPGRFCGAHCPTASASVRVVVE